MPQQINFCPHCGVRLTTYTAHYPQDIQRVGGGGAKHQGFFIGTGIPSDGSNGGGAATGGYVMIEADMDNK